VLSSFRALSRYWRLLVHYLSPHKVQIALLAVILCIAIGVQIATPLVASEFIDRASTVSRCARSPCWRCSPWRWRWWGRAWP